MTITTQQVKLYQSESLSQQDDGGGRKSANEVVDGELNNLFQDISRLDRTYGRVQLAKAFLQIDTANTDIYLGSHAIITDPPDDGSVGVTMFGTSNHADRRLDAQGRVERYLVAGPRTTLYLYDVNLASQRQVLCWQRPEDPLPEVGETLVLSVEASGNALNGTQQFVRISNVQSQLQNFIDGSGSSAVTYQRAVVTLTITTPLEYDFPGGDVVRSPTNSTSPTKVRKTNVADGANYYGVATLAVDITAGDTLIRVDTILAPIVPSATDEEAILDERLGPPARSAVVSGPALSESIPATSTLGDVALIYAARGIFPGSATFTATGGTGAITLVDNGDGTATRTAGGSGTADATAVIDYVAGVITVSDTGALSAGTLAYTPAAFPSNTSHTQGEEITTTNRGQVRVATLDPIPAPGSIVVSYRALGVWYDLVDNGTGALIGASGTGSGVINYTTGSLAVTLGFEPDVGSHVLIGWGTGVHYAYQIDGAIARIGVIELTTEEAIKPGTLEITWTHATVDYTVTDDGNGLLIGDCFVGEVDYNAKTLSFIPTVVPALLAELGISYTANTGATYQPDPQPTPSGGDVSFTIPDAPLEPGSVIISALFKYAGSSRVVRILDDGAGVLQVVQSGGTSVVGTLNYTTGLATFDASQLYYFSVYSTVEHLEFRRPDGSLGFPSYGGGSVGAGEYVTVTTSGWVRNQFTFTYDSIVSVSYQEAGSGAAQSETASLTQLGVDLSEVVLAELVSGSLLLNFNGTRYRDVGGNLFTGYGASPTDAGNFNAASGLGVLTAWTPGAVTAGVLSALSVYGRYPLTDVIWRTKGAPIRNGSLIITAQRPGFSPEQATADDDGIITGPNIAVDSTIVYSTGVYTLHFTAAVIPDSALYNAVALTYLPLGAELIGLDPVRLPLDGRVPIIRPANVLVIHNTAQTTLTNPVSAATPYSLGRGALSYAIVRDAEGLPVPTDKWTADLDLGEVTFLAPLDLSEYVQPLVVEHRIEDSVLCTGAQLSGDIDIYGTISHDFEAGSSYVSSALLFGDLQARAFNVVEQQTWTGVWSDSLIGSASVGQYNTAGYPIAVTNQGAIKERWRFQFTTSQQGNIIGESLGQLNTTPLPIDSVIAPLGPDGVPYFSIDPDGWGAGWVAGNVVRFNTDACGAPIWFVRCTLAGPIEEPTDSFRVQLRGDAN